MLARRLTNIQDIVYREWRFMDFISAYLILNEKGVIAVSMAEKILLQAAMMARDCELMEEFKVAAIRTNLYNVTYHQTTSSFCRLVASVDSRPVSKKKRPSSDDANKQRHQRDAFIERLDVHCLACSLPEIFEHCKVPLESVLITLKFRRKVFINEKNGLRTTYMNCGASPEWLVQYNETTDMIDKHYQAIIETLSG